MGPGECDWLCTSVFTITHISQGNTELEDVEQQHSSNQVMDDCLDFESWIIPLDISVELIPEVLQLFSLAYLIYNG